MEQPTRFVGMDVHKETIVVAVTATGEVGKATAYGTFPNTAAGLEKLVKRLRQAGGGFGVIALASILNQQGLLANSPSSNPTGNVFGGLKSLVIGMWRPSWEASWKACMTSRTW